MPLGENPNLNESVLENPSWIRLPNELTPLSASSSWEQTGTPIHFRDKYPEVAGTYTITTRSHIYCFDSEGRPFLRPDTKGVAEELDTAGFTKIEGMQSPIMDLLNQTDLISPTHHPDIAPIYNENMKKLIQIPDMNHWHKIQL